MAPQGYADGLLKPANQVRAQKNLVKSVPGSNIPPQPAKVKRVRQSVEQALEEKNKKLAQQSYLPPGGHVGPVREIEQMKGLSGMHREIDMDKHMKAREQIMKITGQQDKPHRGRAVADAMRQLTLQANERSIPLVDDSSGGAQQGRALSPSPRGDTMRWRSQTPEAERRSKQRQQQETRDTPVRAHS